MPNRFYVAGITCLSASALITGMVFYQIYGEDGILPSYQIYKQTNSNVAESQMVMGAQWILDNQAMIILGTASIPIGAMLIIQGSLKNLKYGESN